jgi:hypothetical protein
MSRSLVDALVSLRGSAARAPIGILRTAIDPKRLTVEGGLHPDRRLLTCRSARSVEICRNMSLEAGHRHQRTRALNLIEPRASISSPSIRFAQLYDSAVRICRAVYVDANAEALLQG